MIESRYLPHSAKRFKLTASGSLIASDGSEIEVEEVDGHQSVKISWLDGVMCYPIALLMIFTFTERPIPEHLVREIEPLYKDDDRKNLNKENIIYRFKNVRVESDRFPGYYYIPGFTDYVLDESGEMISNLTGKVKSWSKTQEGGSKNQTGGYAFTRLYSDMRGKSVVLFQHRALLLTFTKFEGNVESLVCNHKDGNPSNNSLSNLELITYRENNIHAVETGLRRGQSLPVLSKNVRTGEVLRFESASRCALHHGYDSPTIIFHRIRHNPDVVYPDFLLYKFDDGKPWPDVDESDVIRRGGVSNLIVSRNVFTGDIVVYDSIAKASAETGVLSETIGRHVFHKTLIPIHGYNFRYVKDAKTLPEHHEINLVAYRENPVYPSSPIIQKDSETGEVIIYPSTTKAMENLGIGKSYLHHLIKEKKLFKGRFILSQHNLKENIKVPLSK